MNGLTPHPAEREGEREGGKECVDGVKEKKGKKRPASGYYLPESIPECDLISDLGPEDDRSPLFYTHTNTHFGEIFASSTN